MSLLALSIRSRATSMRLLSQTRRKKTMVAKPPSAAIRRRRVEQNSQSKKKENATQYGLNPVDFSAPPPIAPTLLPPPPKGGFQSMLAPVSIAALLASGIYLYFNGDSETYEYWRQVETGGNIVQDDDDDDEYEDDDE